MDGLTVQKKGEIRTAEFCILSPICIGVVWDPNPLVQCDLVASSLDGYQVDAPDGEKVSPSFQQELRGPRTDHDRDLTMWLWVLGIALVAVVLYDPLQKRHAILRSFPILGHFRYILESIGPELRQYIVTDNDE